VRYITHLAVKVVERALQVKVQVDPPQSMEPLQVVLAELIPVAMQWVALVITEYRITFTAH
jgi:hypothetical protein